MRIIIIRIHIMSLPAFRQDEIILRRQDIDFSCSTVQKLRKTLLTQLELVAHAICETPQALKHALEQDRVVLGACDSQHGQNLIYIHLNEHDYVVPYIVSH